MNMVTGEGTQKAPKELLPKCPRQCQLFALDLGLHTKSLKPMWFGQCYLRRGDAVRAERAVGGWARPRHTVGTQCVLSVTSQLLRHVRGDPPGRPSPTPSSVAFYCSLFPGSHRTVISEPLLILCHTSRKGESDGLDDKR